MPSGKVSLRVNIFYCAGSLMLQTLPLLMPFASRAMIVKQGITMYADQDGGIGRGQLSAAYAGLGQITAIFSPMLWGGLYKFFLERGLPTGYFFVRGGAILVCVCVCSLLLRCRSIEFVCNRRQHRCVCLGPGVSCAAVRSHSFVQHSEGGREGRWLSGRREGGREGAESEREVPPVRFSASLNCLSSACVVRQPTRRRCTSTTRLLRHLRRERSDTLTEIHTHAHGERETETETETERESVCPTDSRFRFGLIKAFGIGDSIDAALHLYTKALGTTFTSISQCAASYSALSLSLSPYVRACLSVCLMLGVRMGGAAGVLTMRRL